MRANLPAEYGPWAKNDDGAVICTGPDDGDLARDPNVVVETVRRDGFYLGRSGTPARRTVRSLDR